MPATTSCTTVKVFYVAMVTIISKCSCCEHNILVQIVYLGFCILCLIMCTCPRVSVGSDKGAEALPLQVNEMRNIQVLVSF